MFPQSLQHHSQMGKVFVFVFGVNKDIIYKYHHKFVQIVSKNSIHKIHEGRGGIDEAKSITVKLQWPNLVLVENIFKYNPKLMVFWTQIILEKYSCSLQLMKWTIYSEQWIFIVDGNQV